MIRMLAARIACNIIIDSLIDKPLSEKRDSTGLFIEFPKNLFAIEKYLAAEAVRLFWFSQPIDGLCSILP